MAILKGIKEYQAIHSYIYQQLKVSYTILECNKNYVTIIKKYTSSILAGMCDILTAHHTLP